MGAAPINNPEEQPPIPTPWQELAYQALRDELQVPLSAVQFYSGLDSTSFPHGSIHTIEKIPHQPPNSDEPLPPLAVSGILQPYADLPGIPFTERCYYRIYHDHFDDDDTASLRLYTDPAFPNYSIPSVRKQSLMAFFGSIKDHLSIPAVTEESLYMRHDCSSEAFALKWVHAGFAYHYFRLAVSDGVHIPYAAHRTRAWFDGTLRAVQKGPSKIQFNGSLGNWSVTFIPHKDYLIAVNIVAECISNGMPIGHAFGRIAYKWNPETLKLTYHPTKLRWANDLRAHFELRMLQTDEIDAQRIAYPYSGGAMTGR